MLSNPLLVAAILCANVALSEWLARRGLFRHLGSALLVIVITAVEANLGLVPTWSPDVAVYQGVFEIVAPLSIFWLLLQVRVMEIWRAGAPMLALFGLGSLGIAAGVLAGMTLVDGAAAFGDRFAALGGMFTGTYVGGSVNFNALALHYDVASDGLLYASANAIDAAMTTVWMIVTVALPRLVRPWWPKRRDHASGAAPEPAATVNIEGESASPFDIAIVLGLGLAAVAASNAAGDALGVPSILVLTTLALAIAQLPIARRLRGHASLGWFAVLIFLAVIGALCDLSAVARIGDLAKSLIGLVLTIFAVHGVVVFGAAALLRLDAESAAVASQAGVGGGTSALALARSLDRPDLAAAGVLMGALGNALGTYLGFAVAGWLS